ncbi:uncharacterized protein E0L32_003578 [Thyridium curvatum]|uniref:RNB domain-containing protein n=1 Tax=Thyridium curvatum TaxID=1093900 RepID=A0A507B9W7_9PEZI|nr:uncharacterized protein E0L32_003578 [Thyridium curvatum]TPX16637.1 hypothetical protein E0L32_003578 [Thyridium curvatum]
MGVNSMPGGEMRLTGMPVDYLGGTTLTNHWRGATIIHCSLASNLRHRPPRLNASKDAILFVASIIASNSPGVGTTSGQGFEIRACNDAEDKAVPRLPGLPGAQLPRAGMAELSSPRPEMRQPKHKVVARLQTEVQSPSSNFVDREPVPPPAGRRKSHGIPIRPIRERLREWEAKNPKVPQEPREDLASKPGAPENSLTRTVSPFMVHLDDDEVPAQPLFDGEELAEVRCDTTLVQAGDLVEVSSSSWRVALLAVCLGRFNGYDHFYTNTGKWFTSQSLRTLFKVDGFVKEDELGPVIEALPSVESPIETLNTLQDLKMGPSRNVGANLISRMQAFAAESDTVHQANCARLDNAFELLEQDDARYMSLDEIANALLPGHIKSKGKFRPAALYAVHKAILTDDLAVRPLSDLGHNRSYLFEISPRCDVERAERVEAQVRRFLDEHLRLRGSISDQKLEKSVLGNFLLKARQAIDQSRRSRSWSAHGVLGPFNKAQDAEPVQWSTLDLNFIQFMHRWAGFEDYPLNSRVQWIGAAILRAVERYQDSEYLTASTGWTFLQEIGYLKPWDIQARYSTRIPGVVPNRQGSLDRVQPASLVLEEDIFAGTRKAWKGVTAYCIDSASTTDIDDAVSIQPTETPGEYWIHIHVADPGSCIRPGSSLAEFAKLVPQTAYLPGHFERMFPGDLVRERFSLAPDRPCLTFSARVNEEGAVLEHDITPGTLDSVIYIEPAEVSAVCGVEPPSLDIAQQVFEVGTPRSLEWPPKREMTTAAELSAQDASNLQTLSRLAAALHSVRLSKGAMPLYWPRPTAQVSLADTQVTELDHGFFRCAGDPYIRVSYGGSSATTSSSNPLVESTMRLAGEVAARWCADRAVPIPFRVQPRAAADGPGLARLRAFAEEVLYPPLRAGRRPRDADARAMRALLGHDDVAAAPGRHFTMGADAYAKATSPLRRYADLLVHWQVGAALLEERRRGASLRVVAAGGGGGDRSFLPFSRAQMEDDVLPMLRVRERAMRALDNADGADQWILQALVRAWKWPDHPAADSASAAGNGSKLKLPSEFRFEVLGVAPKRGLVRGRLDWFERPAVMEPEGLEAAGVTVRSVRAGDVFRVRLEDVNVPERRISVRALERVVSAEE